MDKMKSDLDKYPGDGDKNDTTAATESHPDADSKSEKRFLAYKIIKQITFTGLWVTLGLAFGINGPCLPDLKDHLAANYEEISRGLTGISVGFFVGSMIGGVTFALFYKHADLIASLSMLVCTIGLALIPWTSSLWQVTLCFFLVGLTGGCKNSGVNTLVLHLWGKSSGTPMYLMHLGFGVGGFLAPQVARPFISDVTAKSNDVMINATGFADVTYNDNSSNVSISSEAVTVVDRDTDISGASNESDQGFVYNEKLFYPYTILASISFFFSLALLCFYIIGTPKGFPSFHKRVPLKKLFSPKVCASSHPCYGLILLGLLFLHFVQAVGGEIIYGNFIYSYATETEVGFDKDSAATLTSLFWFSHMAGRFIGAMLEICIPTSIILFCDIALLTVTALCLCFFGSSVSIALWVLTVCHGCLISPLYPAGMVWANNHLDVNSMSTMILVLGSSVGLASYVYACGYMFEEYGPQWLMYLLILCSVALMLIYICLSIIGRKFLKIKEQDRSRNTDTLLVGVKTYELTEPVIYKQ